MDRPQHEFGGPNMPQQQQQQQQHYGFHPQQQQFPPQPIHGGPPPFLPQHPSTLQQFPYPRSIPPQPQMYQHLPPHPHILRQPPPSFPPHSVPPPYHNPYEATPPPPPTTPPSDPELQKRIDKLVEYAIKNGPEFEAMVREREQDNPAYGFLFVGGEGHGYYRYKLWINTRPPMGGGGQGPFNPVFPAMVHPPNPMMSPGQSGVVPPPMMGSSHMQQPPQFPPFYDQQLPHHAHPMLGHGYGRPEFDHSSRPPPFKGVSRPLPSDIEMELNGVLNGLTGTKDSIKGAKTWFMQRSALIPALAEALCDRMFANDDPERQLHIIYLVNDILFDSLQRRVNPHELDNEALAFKPVLGSMLARIYHNPQNREDNQSRIQKIVQFWASKEVYDKDTIFNLESEMIPTNALQGPRADASPISGDPASGPIKMGIQNSSQWQPENQGSIPNQMAQNPPHVTPLPTPQFHQAPVPSSGFAGSVPIPSSIPPPNLQQAPTASKIGEKPPPYPLFPPGLIPGMVRKMQIGSGVPYSPLSPLDIPTTIPPSNVSQSEILDRVSKFFRDIGEVNPCEGPMKGSDEYEDYEYEKEPQVRKGGACIPPPPSLNADPDTGTFPDGSVERKPGGSGRLGLGATSDPNEPSQYDDVYSSYRKQRSTNYHSRTAAT